MSINQPASEIQVALLPGEVVAAKASKSSRPPHLTSLAVAILGFTMVCGGPFGIEPVVGGIGPFFAVLGCVVLALLWGVPQALITADFGITYPQAGGQVDWVHETIGKRFGIANSWVMACWQLIDLPAATLLISSYITQENDTLSSGALYGIQFACLSVAFVLNVLGIDALQWSAGILSAVIALPFFVLPFAPLFHVNVDWSALQPTNRPNGWNTNIAVAIATLLWCYNGYWAIGTVANEVKPPVNTRFPRGVLGAVAISTASFTFPMIFGATIQPDYTQWGTGYFVTVGKTISPWLGEWLLVTAVFNNFVCFNSCLGAYTRGIHASARKGDFYALSKLIAPTQSIVPTLAIVCVVNALLMSGFGFDVLIVVDSSVSMIMTMFLLASFICHKSTRRGDALVKGRVWMWMLVTPLIILIVFSFYVLFYQAVWGPIAGFAVLIASFLGPWCLDRFSGCCGCTCSGTRRQSTSVTELDIVQ